MKRNDIKWLSCAGFYLLLAGFTASCSNDSEVTTVDGAKINLYVAGIETRTTEDNVNKSTIHSSNFVGVYVKGNSDVTFGDNNKHSVGSNGALTPENAIIAKERDALDIYAYAPHSGSWTGHDASHSFSVSDDQSDLNGYMASDLLYASVRIAKVTKDQEAVGLSFTHKMARLILNITTEEDADDLKNAKVTVNNTKPTTTFNPSTGGISPATGSTRDITAVKTLGNKTAAYCVIVPQEIATGTTLFTVETSDKKFKLNLESEANFESGKSYTYTVNIKASDPEDVTITLTSENTHVTDWTEVTGAAATDATEEKIP